MTLGVRRQLALAVLLTAGVSRATTIQVTDMDWDRASSMWINVNGEDKEVWAGLMKIRVDNLYDRIALCVDLFTGIMTGQDYSSSLQGPGTVPNGGRVSWLIENWIPSAMDQNSEVLGAALQLAIWDIVHDNGDGLEAGSIQRAATTNSDIVAAAMNFGTTSAGMASFNSYVYRNVSFIDGSPAQTLIGPAGGPGPTPSPEPATIAMMGAALVILSGRLLRRNRTQIR
jgi:hypothetical protein